MLRPPLPSRRAGRRRDRHGRGVRGPLLPPVLPGRRSPREEFAHLVASYARDLIRRYPQLAEVEFAIEDIPPSAPGRFEPHAITLARTFAADRSHALACRMVFYRLPMATRARHYGGLANLVRCAMAQQCADYLGVPPEQIYPDFDLWWGS
ncbi:MAG: metallopeptidase family protein [Bowdeniella nasicola]|nr:metallopeptidase family protein [Bowdeniella nasicola]